jgi:hypothetical protein
MPDFLLDMSPHEMAILQSAFCFGTANGLVLSACVIGTFWLIEQIWGWMKRGSEIRLHQHAERVKRLLLENVDRSELPREGDSPYQRGEAPATPNRDKYMLERIAKGVKRPAPKRAGKKGQK